MDLSQADRLAQMALEMSEQPDLSTTLDQILVSARSSISCEGAGVLLSDGGKLASAAATGKLARQAGALQASAGDGPWRLGWTSTGSDPEETVLIAVTGSDPRFPRWARAVAGLGFGSVLSIRLFSPVRTLGVLNLYGDSPGTFSAADRDLAVIFCRHASVALTSAQYGESLRSAVNSRHVIGQAQGILMERYQVDADRAFEVLRRYSQHKNIKLRLIAEQVIDHHRLPD